MASGLVAKKIALFELRPGGSEIGHCRLKRKHAIRRKRYTRERRLREEDGVITATSATSAGGHLQSSSSSPSSLKHRDSRELSASCSALYENDEDDNSAPSSSELYSRVNMKTKNTAKTSGGTLLRTRCNSLEDFSMTFRLVEIDIDSTNEFEEDRMGGLYETSYEYWRPNGKTTVPLNDAMDAFPQNDDEDDPLYENIIPKHLLTGSNPDINGESAAFNLLRDSCSLVDLSSSSSDLHIYDDNMSPQSSFDVPNSNITNTRGGSTRSGDKSQYFSEDVDARQSFYDSVHWCQAEEMTLEEPLYEELTDYCISSCDNCRDTPGDTPQIDNSFFTGLHKHDRSGQLQIPPLASGCINPSQSEERTRGCSNCKNNVNAHCADEVTATQEPVTALHLSVTKVNELLQKGKDSDDSLESTSLGGAATEYESVYSEPLYGHVSGDQSPPKLPDTLPPPRGATSPSTIYGGSLSSGTTMTYGPGSILSSSTLIAPGHNSTYNDSISSFDTQSQSPPSLYYDPLNDKLPPPPPNKFSSIAKSAGKRLARKFMQMRKISRSSLDQMDTPSISSSSSEDPGNTSPAPGAPDIRRVSLPNNIGSTMNRPPLRRPLSRPNIPPPEPPKETYALTTKIALNHINNKISDHKNDEFEDSDFYDSDSELIRNFVSQVQPIYSMEEEPLYQYYTYGINLKPEDDYQPVIPKNLGLTLDMLVPRVGQRTLWCELPEVQSSGILGILSDKQKQLQEAIFEILTSEVSYLKSLDVLITLFSKNEELIGVLTEEERGFVFGNIVEVKDCAQSFLAELLGKWEESWYIQEVGEIVNRFTRTRFGVYKDYCRNKPYQDRTMQKLRHSRDEFVNIIKSLEESSECQMLKMDSFLMLPMQRITRLPLLVNAVIQRSQSAKERTLCEEALENLTNLVIACNDAARESQDAEETAAMVDKIEIVRNGLRMNNLGQFLMKGDFLKNPFDQSRGGQLNWTFRKSKRTFYWVLLFSNQLLITKKKPNGKYEVLDAVSPSDSSIKPLPNLEGVSKDFQHFFMLHFNRKETVYFLSARTASEVDRWRQKLDNMKTQRDLKVEAIFLYEARREDELTFNVGDFIHVTQVQPDGWYYGTKEEDGESGWFPGNYCAEV